MSTFVVMTDTFPGYWGKGPTELAARKHCRECSNKPTIVWEISDEYCDIYVDQMGQVWGDLTEEAYARFKAGEPKPKFMIEVFRRGARGKKSPLEPNIIG